MKRLFEDVYLFPNWFILFLFGIVSGRVFPGFPDVCICCAVGYGGSPDEAGETTLDVMIIDGINVIHLMMHVYISSH